MGIVSVFTTFIPYTLDVDHVTRDHSRVNFLSIAISLGTSPDPAPQDPPLARERVLWESDRFCKGRVAVAKFVIETTKNMYSLQLTTK